jgi:metal-dependent amidase/aminoacylase/carboxypeptidase family protein
MVNAIPAVATLESYVRGATFEGIEKANKKVNRALIGAALSLGNNIDITDIPGYAPLNNDKELMKVVGEAAALAVPEYPFDSSDHMGTGSTDMGDLSCIMPVVHPYAAGAAGKGHGSDYRIADPESACIGSAKLQMQMLSILLSNGAQRAKKIISEFKPMFASKKEYLAFMDSLNSTGDRIVYGEDGIAKVFIGKAKETKQDLFVL